MTMVIGDATDDRSGLFAIPEDQSIELTRLNNPPASSSSSSNNILSSAESDVKDEHTTDHEHTQGASNLQTAINIVISFVGAGILGMPHAFSESGWLLGTCVLFVVSALNVYAMLLLPQVKHKLGGGGAGSHIPNIASYGDVGKHVLGTTGECFVNVCLGISQAGFATAYIIFIAANLYNIAGVPRLASCLLCIPGLSLLVQFQSMKHLSKFSLLANMANFGAMFAVLFADVEHFGDRVPIDTIKFPGLLNVASIAIYSMEGVGLILSLESSTQDKKGFPNLLRFMLVLITSFMGIFGTLGYWAFGDNTLTPITLNLIDHYWAATFVKLSLCLGLYLTFPVMMFPCWSIVDSLYPELKEDGVRNFAFRSSLVVLSVSVAFAVPNFGVFLTLVGSSICTLLGFILPCYFHNSVFGDESPAWQTTLNWVLIVGGAAFGMFGTYSSFVELLNGELHGHER